MHDDVIKWKHFPRNWPFVWGIHRSPVNSPHKGQWRGALMFSLIWARINAWVNNRGAGDLRRHRAHYDFIVMVTVTVISKKCWYFMTHPGEHPSVEPGIQHSRLVSMLERERNECHLKTVFSKTFLWQNTCVLIRILLKFVSEEKDLHLTIVSNYVFDIYIIIDGSHLNCFFTLKTRDKP